jgi:exopolyphosphatase / guanosine-5'-triphosphate,3'-diphosphate pyrophosphatase
VRVGIVDVGANTLRLLVASGEGDELQAVHEERVQLGLGEEIEQTGEVGEQKLRDAEETARAHVRCARKLGCTAIEVLVTSPGRQAGNGDELVSRLAAATAVRTRVLTSEEEAELAWRGALSAAGDLPDTVAVCDVGGGSAQIAVGASWDSPSWIRSVNIGSLRLTRRTFENDPPDGDDIDRAQTAIALEFADVTPPLPLAAIAVGGTARALRRVVGGELDGDALRVAVKRLSKRSSKKIVKEFGVDGARARTMTAGALIFLEIQRRLSVPLQVGRGGLREGAALELIAEAEASVRSA